MPKDESGGGYYQKWYEANREQLSERRKKRYKQDPTVREKAVKRQRKYRKEHDRPSTKGQAKFREVNGNKVQVYRIRETASYVGCSIEFIRKYEALGVIPEPVVGSAQRYYTMAQIKLMKDFYLLMAELKYTKDPALKQAALDKHAVEMRTHWEGE